MKTDREIRERLLVGGAERLSDEEVLALIVGEGTDTMSAVELAGQIIAGFGGGLSELAAAPVGSLRTVAGCGTVRAARIAAAGEFARRVREAEARDVSVVVSKEDVLRLFAPLAELGHEEFWALYLTSGGRVLDRVRLSQGGVAGTVVDHKLVIKRAIELLAPSLILVHNHPSGIATPSPQDEAVTRSIGAAAALFEIALVDHIIISRSGGYSFAENHRL
jgi:DNA repair protein RadC